MMEIFIFLNEYCNESYILSQNRVIFVFNNFDIIFSLEIEIPVEKEWNYKVASDKLELIKSFKVNSVHICSREDQSTREDIPQYSIPQSICSKLFVFLNKLLKYNKGLVSFYNLTIDFGYEFDEFCSPEKNYLFEIYIDKDFFYELNIYKYILSSLTEAIIIEPPIYYWEYYNNQRRIKDNKELHILHTNTKVRRLGYFKLLSSMMENKKYVSTRYVPILLESYVESYNEVLKLHKNDKGKINKTKSGVSAKPYIQLAKDLKLIVNLNNVYIIGKEFKVYEVLRNKFFSQSENIFNLNHFDKIFFLEIIFKKDYFYLFIILEYIYINTSTSYAQLNKTFQKLILRRLTDYSSHIFEKDSPQFRNIQNIIKRINDWEQTEVYLEHVLMPRINWLYDLGLIEMDKSLNITMTIMGERFFNNLCYWNDINLFWVINSDDFIDHFLTQVFKYTFDSIEPVSTIDQSNLYFLIDKYVEESFSYFSTLAPNRVTSSQAILFTKYCIYFNNNIQISSNYITDYLSSREQKKFIFKYQIQYSDGYIQIRG